MREGVSREAFMGAWVEYAESMPNDVHLTLLAYKHEGGGRWQVNYSSNKTDGVVVRWLTAQLAPTPNTH